MHHIFMSFEPWHLFCQVQFFFSPFRDLNKALRVNHIDICPTFAKARNLFRQMQLFYRDWLKKVEKGKEREKREESEREGKRAREKGKGREKREESKREKGRE